MYFKPSKLPRLQKKRYKKLLRIEYRLKEDLVLQLRIECKWGNKIENINERWIERKKDARLYRQKIEAIKAG